MLPSQNGVLTNEQMPSPAHPTFAHSAGAAGYRPYLAGKIHALGPDQLMGFTDREIGDHGPNYPGGGKPVRGALDGAMGPNPSSLRKVGIGRHAYQVRDEYAAEAVISYLERHAIEQRATLRREPFFVTVGLLLPHQPYVAREEDYRRYEGRVGMPNVPSATTSTDAHPFLRWWREATGISGGVPEEVVLKARTAYWAMVDRMDRIIGSILDTLARLGLADNTVVVYTSDHGDHVGEHGLWWKQTLLEPAVKVPGIISWPGVIPAGTRSRRVAGLVDVSATLVQATGGPALPRSVGRSMLEVLSGGSTGPSGADWPDITISEHCADRDQGAGLGAIDVPEPHYQRMVRRGDFKYIDHGTEPPQLFDLSLDPDETSDLAGDPAHARVQSELAAISRGGWDPERIMIETRTSIDEVAVIKQWARHTNPPDRYRWTMNPDYNALDEPESSLG
jgi:choline-sulfatase